MTALCSPTRAALLTGRNHHAVGMGFLADLPTSHPGYTARIPRSAATLPRLLRDAGWSTLAVGKWHLVPRGERAGAGPFEQWPLGLGFERFYGFLRGDANQWAPELVRDNSFVEPFRLDEDFSESRDLATEHPDVLERLQQQWSVEAEANNVLPLADSLIGRLSAAVQLQYHVGQSVTLYPQAGPVSDEVLPLLAGGGRIVADVEVADQTPSGVLFAIGDRNGGLAAYVVDGKLNLAVALPGETLKLQSGQQLSPGHHRIGCVLRLVSGGVAADAVVDDAVVATDSTDHTLPLVWQHGGTHLTLGYDRGLPVCDDYQPPFAWNGTLHKVSVEAGQFQLDQLDSLRSALQAD